VAGVALGDSYLDIYRRFAWQAWHLRHWAGSGGAWARLVAGDAAALCEAGVALGDIHLCFSWQVRHLVTATTSFCVAAVALMALGWIRWRAWARLCALSPR